MTKIYYLAARPETVFSLVHVGTLPEVLPFYLKTRELEFFESIESCLSATTAISNQCFLLEIHKPEVEDSYLGTQVLESSTYRALQIDTAWVKRIFINSKKAEKLLLRLFNSKCPIEVEIKPELFSDKTSSSKKVDVEEKATEPSKDKEPKLKVATGSPFTYLKKGDLLGSNMQTLVNTVNCVGVMGKGIAFTFKERYPQMFKEYKKLCSKKKVEIGKPYLHKESSQRWILNFPTKDHWRQNSKMEYLEEGLQYLAKNIKPWGITSLAIPPLGCGNGGLVWEEVRPLIERHLKPIGIPIEIYVPVEKPEDKHNKKRKQPSSTSTSASADVKFFKPASSKQTLKKDHVSHTDSRSLESSKFTPS